MATTTSPAQAEFLQAIIDINYSPMEYINNGGLPVHKGQYIGYKLITTDDEIMVAIDNDRQCCESFGVALTVPKDLSSENLNKLTHFFGNPGDQSIQILSKEYVSFSDNEQLLLSLRIINSVGIEDDFSDLYEHNWSCIKVGTNVGDIYLVAWDCHNGYYSHESQLVCADFQYSVEL